MGARLEKMGRQLADLCGVGVFAVLFLACIWACVELVRAIIHI